MVKINMMKELGEQEILVNLREHSILDTGRRLYKN